MRLTHRGSEKRRSIPGLSRFAAGQVDVEAGSFAGLGLEIDPSSQLLDDPEGGGEPQAGPLSGLFGREEGFEDLGLDL